MEDSVLSRNRKLFVTSLRYGKSHFQRLREEPEPGDLIEIARTGCSHWALYVGDDYVVHLAPPGEKSEAGAPAGRGAVRREYLAVVLEDCPYEVNNRLDRLYRPRPPAETLRAAEEAVGREMEVSDPSGSSERFVSDLRYGQAGSRKLREEPNFGDMIEISRIGYSHWALYVGHGYVIHLAPPGEKFEAGAPTGLGVVRRQLLEEVVEKSSFKVNNHRDRLYQPRPIKEMLRAAAQMVGEKLEYSVLRRSSERFVTDLRYGQARSRQLREEPEPGDLIEISRIGCSHWALYEGDGYVLHLAPPGEKSEAGAPAGLGVVRRQLLEEVVENSSYEVNNLLDRLYQPRPTAEMLGSGKEMLGMEVEYSVLSRNSEHLVTDLRYGKAYSRKLRAEPEPGDLIEIARIGYFHWVLYVGDGYVIHLAPPGEKSGAGAPAGRGAVRREYLAVVLEDCPYEVNNRLDQLYKPRPKHEILRSGKQMIGQEMEYSVLSRSSEFFVTDLRYGQARSRQLREEPEPGDLIEISRIGCSHWALYVGDGYVLHLAPPGEKSGGGAPTGRGVVRRQLLVDVVENSSYEVNNHQDHLYRPRPIKEMLRAAEKVVGREMEVSDPSGNSERFVTDLRYGQATGWQLRQEPEPGDLIEIFRFSNSHWALYVGDGYVIHLAPPGEKSGAGAPTCLGVVRRELFVEVVGQCFYKVNNYLDRLYQPRPTVEVLWSAEKVVGQEMEISDLSGNCKHLVTELRYGKIHNRQLREEPEPGDLIEISRIGCSHWALYVGDGYVLHLAPPGEKSEAGAPAGRGVVRRQLLVEVVENSPYEVNNHRDRLYRPRPTAETLRAADEMVGREMEISDLSKNSEYFVIDLRYSKACSRQLREEPEPGDLIEISRIGCSHWALYEGDGYVLHLAPPGEKSEAGAPTGLGVVRRQLLVEVVENSSYEVNNHWDRLYQPRPPAETLRAAQQVVGQEMEISDPSSNCERFVADLRYGKAGSRRLREEPNFGDLIEIARIGCSHWALYVGDGYAIHLAPPGEKSEAGDPAGRGAVRRQLLVDVVENSSFRVNNHLDNLYQPRPTAEMLRAAEEAVGREMEVSDPSGSSERFVSDLRYGQAGSRKLREEPKPGDLIEISRIGCSHWALYEGDGYVIHLAPPGENSEAGAPAGFGVVKRELLMDVVENSSFQVNNYLDHVCKPWPIKKILAFGNWLVGRNPGQWASSLMEGWHSIVGKINRTH